MDWGKAMTRRSSSAGIHSSWKALGCIGCATALFAAWIATGVADNTSSGHADGLEPKVILITFDGMRSQYVFNGADPVLVRADVHEDLHTYVSKAFGSGSSMMPFLHGVIARQGVLLGNRDARECAEVPNDMWFSYPGYTEILAGKPNPAIVENDPIQTPDATVLQWANKRPEFAGKAGMVGTWSLFPHIVNAEHSGVPVNAALKGQEGTDVRTGRAGLELLSSHKPRLLHIAFDDTDKFAHVGNYESYLASMERGDEFLRQLWQQLQTTHTIAGRPL